jgi:hypothetical protein
LTDLFDAAISDLDHAIQLWPQAHDQAWSPLRSINHEPGSTHYRRGRSPRVIDTHAERHYRAALAQLPVLANAVGRVADILPIDRPSAFSPPSLPVRRLQQLRLALTTAQANDAAHIREVEEHSREIVRALNRAVGTPGLRHPCPNPDSIAQCAGVRSRHAQTCVPCRKHHEYTRRTASTVKRRRIR